MCGAQWKNFSRTRLTMLTTYSHGTTIAREPVRQGGTELHSGMVHGVYSFL